MVKNDYSNDDDGDDDEDDDDFIDLTVFNHTDMSQLCMLITIIN